LPIVHLVDAFAPVLMLGYAIGRIGCQLSGDGDWGIVNNNRKPISWMPDWLWSYQYPHNVIGEGAPIPGCSGPYCNQLIQSVYPTALYEVIMCFTVFFILWSLRRKIKIPGQLFGIYLIFNGIERFAIESIRVNTHYESLPFKPTQAQIISIILFITGIVLVLQSKKWFEKNKSAQRVDG
jgi:prolipoprotein diacylglyceryltransferase